MKLSTLALGLAAIFALAAPADAALINTIIGNFDIAFDGQTGALTDFNNAPGGNLDPNEARRFSSLEIEVDGSTTAMLMDPPATLWGDLLIEGLGGSLLTQQLVQGASDGGTFDFFTPDGDLLRLEMDSISYVLFTTPIPSLNFFNFFAEATVVDQDLPGGIRYASPVLLSYTATEVMVMSGESIVTASGAMTITGDLVPEPATMGLAMFALVGAVAGRRR